MHRRAGKTVAVVNDLIKSALTCPLLNPRAAYIAPFYRQAKAVAWDYAQHYSRAIPGITINQSELRIDYPNGGRFQLFGADNYDALRGMYFDDVGLDEPADFPPDAWPTVIRPALADRKGRATFVGTSKGKNQFYDVWVKAGEDDEWFAQMLKASESGIVDQAELDAARSDMGENRYQQEFECSFDAAIEGAYYADLVSDARQQGRIGNVAVDPLMTTYAIWDIGGTGAKADACSVWVAQFVGREIRWLDYYEAKGQPLASHVSWLRSNGYGDAHCVLPHDGATNDRVHDVSYESALQEAGFQVTVVPNQGRGAAKARIEEGRRLFSRMWFAGKCEPGLSALSWYHEKMDEKRGIGLGPEHDWSSHGADAFGLGCVFYEEPSTTTYVPPAPRMRQGGWLGA